MIASINQTFLSRDPRFSLAAVFHSGQEALEWLRKRPVELLILDVYMPRMSGLELLRELRRRGIGIDAVMVTAANDGATVDTLLKMGVVDYLVKPFTVERFQQALDTFCRHKEAVHGQAVTQGELDKLFAPPDSGDRSAPKGLQESTLKLIWDCLHAAPAQGLPSEAISKQTNLSVVTVRRYANYLVERGEACSTVNYDTGGRPCRLYQLKK